MGTVLRLDLREDHTLQFLQHVLQNRTVAWVHFSPPTGSISTAFRSKEHPRGLPGLVEPAASKVAAANRVYDNVVLLLQSLQQSFPSVGFSIEHPLGSPFVSFFEYLEKIELYCSKENHNLGIFRERKISSCYFSACFSFSCDLL